MITIIDYGMGNLRSVQKVFEFIGRKAIITNDREKILSSSLVVLPGVGSFLAAIKNLQKLNLVETVKKIILDGKPFLGLCLGMQILFEKSEEGNCKGLGILKGEVRRFNFSKLYPHQADNSILLKVPHVGWNNVRWNVECRIWKIFKGIECNSYFYFVHSYYVKPENKNIIASTTNYGIDFASSIFYKNIFATQFHPEKSQRNGLKLLKNYVDYTGN